MKQMPVSNKTDLQSCPAGFISRAAKLCAAIAFAMLGCDAVSTDVEPTHSYDEIAPSSLHEMGELVGSIQLEGGHNPTEFDATVAIEGVDLSGRRVGAKKHEVDDQGVFSVEVPPGRYTVSYEARSHMGDVREHIEVDFAQKRRLAPMTLRRWRVQVRGRVLLGHDDGSTHNAAAVTVRLVTPERLVRDEPPPTTLGEDALPDSLLAQTNAAGVFVFDGVPVEHSYVLLAHHPAFVPGSKPIKAELKNERINDLGDVLTLEPSDARVALNEGRGFTRNASIRLTVRAAEPLFEHIEIKQIGMDSDRPDDCGPAQSYADGEEHDCVPTPLGRPVERAVCHLVTLGPASQASADPCGDITRGEHRFEVNLLDRHGSTTSLTEASIVFDDRPIAEDQIIVTLGPPPVMQDLPSEPADRPAPHARYEREWFYLRGRTSPNGGTVTLNVDAVDDETPRHTYTGCFEMTHHGSAATRCDVSDAHALLVHEQQVPLPPMPPSIDPTMPVAGAPFHLHLRVRDGARNETSIRYDACLDDVAPASLGFTLYRDRAADEADQPPADDQAEDEVARLELRRPGATPLDPLPPFVTRDPRIFFEFNQPPEDDNPCGLAGARGRDLALIRIQDAVDEENVLEVTVPRQGPIEPVRWDLPPGDRENWLFVTFEDLAGNTTRETVRVVLDTEPPIAPRLVPRDEPLADGPLAGLEGYAAREHNGIYWTPHARTLDFVATSGDLRDDAKPETQLRVYIGGRNESVDATDAFQNRHRWTRVQWPEPLPEESITIQGEFRDIAGNRALSDPVVVRVDNTPPEVSANIIGAQPFGLLRYVSINIVPVTLHLVQREEYPETVRFAFSEPNLAFSCPARDVDNWEWRQVGAYLCALNPALLQLDCQPGEVPPFSGSREFEEETVHAIAGDDGPRCLQVHAWDLVGNHAVSAATPIYLDSRPPASPQIENVRRHRVEGAPFHQVRVKLNADFRLDLATAYEFTLQASRDEPPFVRSHSLSATPFGAACRADSMTCVEADAGSFLFSVQVTQTFFDNYWAHPEGIRMEVRGVDQAGNVSDPAVLTCRRSGNLPVCN